MNPDRFDPPHDRRRETRLVELIAACIEGAPDPEGHAELEALLAASPEARAAYMAHMQIDAALDWKVRGGQSLKALARFSRSHRLAIPMAEAAPHAGYCPSRGRSRKALISVIAIAASLLLALTAALWTAPRGVEPLAEGSNDRDLAIAGAGDDSKHDLPAAAQAAIAELVELSSDCHWFVENRRPADRRLRAGDLVRLTRGHARMHFTCGATVTMRSPAAIEVVSPNRTRAVLGTLTAHVEKGAEGFTVETPRTTVVDLGTDFGVDVSEHGSTDVVVFTGAVDLHYDDTHGVRSRRRLTAGEAARVSGEGTASRIVSINDGQFPFDSSSAVGDSRTPVISAVRDNIRRGKTWHYYEIVHGGMREDAKAFVDRKDHEWNGVGPGGMPSYLLGGDYVKTFNDDKQKRQVEIRVTLDRPAILYVLHDNRTPAPRWLLDNFLDTGDDIGVDGGGYARADVERTTAVGPGLSIDDTFSIWRRDMPHGGEVELGAIQLIGQGHNMYGIVAVPLELDGADDFAGISDEPTVDAARLAPDSRGRLAVNGRIERPGDADVFSFDWPGGALEVACRVRGLTTLDPLVAVHGSAGGLVGYARFDRAGSRQASVTMDLPPGLYYAAVTGDDQVGEVGRYRLQIRTGAGGEPRPLKPSPSLGLTADPRQSSIVLAWNELPGADSYTVEKSSDAVRFEPLATTTVATFADHGVDAAAAHIYRVRANRQSDFEASAPLLVRTRPTAVECAQGSSRLPKAIVLQWRDVPGDGGYRIERSADGATFKTIGAAEKNASGFRDEQVEPGRRYFYRITTLDRSGDAAVSSPISALTAVAELSATAISSEEVRLQWSADYPAGRVFLERSACDADEFSVVASLHSRVTEFVDASVVPGKKYRYRVTWVEPAKNLRPLAGGAAPLVRLPDSVDEDHFAVRFTGKLRVDEPGRNTFYLNCDDGGRLFIDGAIVVDNDGRHTAREAVGAIDLAPGEHELEVQYFESYGYNMLDLAWSGPGFEKVEISAARLHNLRYHYYRGDWFRLPFASAAEISPVVKVRVPKQDK